MPKTKTLGVRLTPELITELERLKNVFAFVSYGEMMESWIRLLQNIDEGVCQIKNHPKEWTTEEAKEHLGSSEVNAISSCSQVDSLTLRRLRERFGEDGFQRIQQILKESEGKRHAQA